MVSKRVVLVHGAFHGGWCWSEVVKGLSGRGIEAIALDLPGHGASAAPLEGFEAEVASVREILSQRSDEETLLVGHSYGGAVVTQAAAGSEAFVTGLVYLAAFVPDEGESVVGSMPEVLSGEIMESLRPGEGGSVRVDPALAPEIFYDDCSQETATWATSQLCPDRMESLSAELTGAAWREIESSYVICERDRVLAPAAQRRVAERCTRSVAWGCGHSPMLSDPDRVVAFLTGLAR